MPTQDMIIGHYFLTMQRDGAKGEGRAFGSVAEALMAFDRRELSVQAKIKLRLRDIVPPAGIELSPSGSVLLETTLGRALFNEALPDDYAYADYEVGKKQLGQIVNDLAERYPKVEVAHCLDQLKDLGFHWATRSGVTVSIGDVTTPADKPQILAAYEDRANKIDKQYERGLITEDERRQELIEIWTDATSRLGCGDGGQLLQDQPDLHDGALRGPRKHGADAPDRRHAWSRGQPEGRDHRPADQVQLP